MSSAVTDRDLVRMHVGERMTLAEIGERVGLSRERVRQRVRRAGVGTHVTRMIVREQREAKRVLWECATCGYQEALKPSRATITTYCSTRCARGHNRRYTDDYLLDHLRNLASQLGRTPSQHDINDHDGPAHPTYCKRFGSIREAQRRAGLRPNRRGGWRPKRTPERVP